ncbi:MAG: hypothetical protein J6T84_06315 [Spirochaetaceae bacterium]|nr:hypothetical protein [Spirochaetaceae bacterium]
MKTIIDWLLKDFSCSWPLAVQPVMCTPALRHFSIKEEMSLIKRLVFIFLIFLNFPLFSEPFTLIYEKELNLDFWQERNLKQSEAAVMSTPIIVNESEIAMIIRISNLTEYNYKFEILNISNNSFKQYDLPFLTGYVEIQEINYSQLKNELYIELYENTNRKKLCYKLDSKELDTYEKIDSTNHAFSAYKPLKISDNQILAVLIDEESSNYAYNNFYEEYIGKIILYNSTNVKKERKGTFEEDKIVQFFNDSKGNNILVSDVNDSVYNSEYNILLVMTKHFLKEEKNTTLYLFKK